MEAGAGYRWPGLGTVRDLRRDCEAFARTVDSLGSLQGATIPAESLP